MLSHVLDCDFTCDPHELLPTATQLRAGIEPYCGGEPVGEDLGRQAAFRLWELREDSEDWEYVDRLITTVAGMPTHDRVGVQAHCFYTALSMVDSTMSYYRWFTEYCQRCCEFASNHELWWLYAYAVSAHMECADNFCHKEMNSAKSGEVVTPHTDAWTEYSGRQLRIALMGEAALKVLPAYHGQIYRRLFDIYCNLQNLQKLHERRVGVFPTDEFRRLDGALMDLCRRWEAAAQGSEELYDSYFWPFFSLDADRCWPFARKAEAFLYKELEHAQEERRYGLAMDLWDLHREIVWKYDQNMSFSPWVIDQCLRHWDRAITALIEHARTSGGEHVGSTIAATYREKADFCFKHKRYKAARRACMAGIDFLLNSMQSPGGANGDEYVLDLLFELWLGVGHVEKARRKTKQLGCTLTVMRKILGQLGTRSGQRQFYWDCYNHLYRWWRQSKKR